MEALCLDNLTANADGNPTPEAGAERQPQSRFTPLLVTGEQQGDSCRVYFGVNDAAPANVSRLNIENDGRGDKSVLTLKASAISFVGLSLSAVGLKGVISAVEVFCRLENPDRIIPLLCRS